MSFSYILNIINLLLIVYIILIYFNNFYCFETFNNKCGSYCTFDFECRDNFKCINNKCCLQ
jgi:hypothetical protein